MSLMAAYAFWIADHAQVGIRREIEATELDGEKQLAD